MRIDAITDSKTRARVLIVDDHFAVRQGMAQLLGQEADLTVCDAARYARRALHAGASGYLAKQEAGEMLLPAIRSILAGGSYFRDASGFSA